MKKDACFWVSAAQAAAVTGLLVSAPAWADAIRVTMEPQPLATALNKLGSQTQTNIGFDPDTVAGRQAPAIDGSYSPVEAMKLLLKPSGLAVKELNKSSYIVVAAAEAPPTASSASVGKVEEIVVTAQKRSENLQKVPIAVTALQESTAKALGVKDTTDLQVATPGLIMHHQTNQLTPSLRGISSVNAAAGDESPIAIYLDGVYLAAPTAGIFGFNDIERVEVLKGPQGTLFGRNATGGVISVTTKRPQQTPMLRASIGYGSFDTVDASLYGTAGITPKIAADVAVFWHRQYKGWGRNITTGADVFKDKEFAARTKWLFTPSDATEITIAADYDQAQTPFATIKDSLPGTVVGNALNNLGSHVGDFRTVRTNLDASSFYKQWGLSGHISHELDWARIVSISAYRGGTPSVLTDLDDTQSNFLNNNGRFTLQQFSQELQLLSPDSSRVKWIGGFFYLNNRTRSNSINFGTSLTPSPQTTLVYLITESLSGFGEVTVPIYETTHITGGLRFTNDHQSIEGVTFTSLGFTANTRADQNAQFGKLTWRAAIDHEFRPGLMGYFSYNRGFKSGVYNASAPTSAVVRPTTIDAYEVGLKSEWLDGRLRVNGSLFYYDLKEVQLSVTVVGATRLLNAASAEIKGVDLDVEIVPIKRLTLRGSAAYTDANYQALTNAPFAKANATAGYTITPGDASGNQMVYTPKWTINASALYSIPTESGTYGAAINYYYNGKYYPDLANQFQAKAYSLVNASVDWTSPNDVWNVRIWGKNLTDAQYYTHYSLNALRATGSPSAPPTYGMTLSLKLGG